MVKKPYIYVLFAFFVCFVTTMYAQKNKLKEVKSIALDDSLAVYSQSDIFKFSNVNKIKNYHHREKLAAIQLLSDNNPLQKEKLYRLLRDYVTHFGVENFTKNITFIWTLANLSETYGPPGEAILLYKLVLKHHRQGININNLMAVYNALETDKEEFYVPLDYYYQLVALRQEIDTLRPTRGVALNMGKTINSSKEDYGPTVGNVDEMLLFTSKRNTHLIAGKNVPNEDIFYSLSDSSGYWGDAIEFKHINTVYNEGSACLSRDANFLFFTRCDAPDSRGNCDIYVSKRDKEGAWGKGSNLGPAINSTGWDSHPSLSHSGDTLFFASNRSGGFGLSDIYFAYKNKKGHWNPAQNAGPIINTYRNEVSPFYHHKFDMLYFSSNGQPLNFGNFDIYKSYWDHHSWTEPKNIGPLVNGKGSEYYFTIDSESLFLYYAKSTDTEKDNLDLYSFPAPMGAHPEARAHLTGRLHHDNIMDGPLAGIVSIIDLDHGVEVAPKFLRPDGSFDFDLINKRNYLLIIQGDNFFRFEEIFFMNGNMEINPYVEPIVNKIEFESLEFESGEANILPTMHDDLHKLATFLINHPALQLIINGHTDSAGNKETNLMLSRNRAQSIKNYLTNKFDVLDSRIRSFGHGSSMPIVKEESEADKKLNRRVEFEVKQMDGDRVK